VCGTLVEYHEESTGENLENAPEMEEFIYGEMSSKTYQTIKKLKSLSQSSNKAEAFAAYTKCLEMCKKYNLEFDKVKI
jgi:pyruvoyl-dependent arginine decarboxylase (PvlArgDC)